MLDGLGQFSPREWLVAVPLYGAALATTYDVGFFYGIGLPYFTLFSLPEHILFSFEVIPIAFAAALMIPSGIISYRMGERNAENATPPIPKEPIDSDTLAKLRAQIHAYHSRSQRMLLLVSAVFIVFGIVSVIVRYYFFAATTIALGVSGLAEYVVPKKALREVHFIAWFCVVFLIMSFFLGFQNARGTLNVKTPSHVVTGAKPSGELRGVLIRGGERGILFFDTSTRLVNFLLWPDIKRIQAAQ